jgi:HAD superfamily hydrolase (TIGR01450 family)
MPVRHPDGCNDAEVAAASFSPTPSLTWHGDIRTVLCDLDGVVWLAHEPISGSSEAIARLRSTGRRVLFVTNNSAGRIDQHVAALEAVGVPAVGDVISSATAAAHLVEPGERVLVTGGPGIVEAIEQRGAVAVVNDGTIDVRLGSVALFDAVVVGLHRDFDYARLRSAAAALHGGARLIGTNSDTTFPTPLGLDPGGGAIVAAVAAAGEVDPTFAGKPHQPMAAAIAAVLGDDFDPATTVMVGDRPETDGLMAIELGCSFALVRSGVTLPGQVVEPGRGVDIDIDVEDLAALADAVVS